ncbi:MAG: hypothetical protein M3O71_31455 [Bacteroidota bacterium]|nr:hypothetical protein [Bacteroidota bacterium]
MGEYSDSTQTLFEITFQDYFKHDVVSLKLNKTTIFDGELLDSNTSGFANIKIDLIRKGPHSLTIIYLTERKTIYFSNHVNVTISLNGKLNFYTIWLNKGKYVELSKKDSDRIYFNQTKSQSIWD